MIRSIAMISVLGAASMLPAVCLAHGASCSFIEGGAAVEARYDNGSPMAYCDAEVFRPGEDGEAFQVGSTDPLGRFAFVPDTTGAWRVTVDDGMGHMAEAEIVVGHDTIGGKSVTDRGRFRDITTGIGVIFGIFGLIALFRRSSLSRAKERC